MVGLRHGGVNGFPSRSPPFENRSRGWWRGRAGGPTAPGGAGPARLSEPGSVMLRAASPRRAPAAHEWISLPSPCYYPARTIHVGPARETASMLALDRRVLPSFPADECGRGAGSDVPSWPAKRGAEGPRTVTTIMAAGRRPMDDDRSPAPPRAELPEKADDPADQAYTAKDVELGGGAKLASLGDLAAGIAHEINNPLAIIVEEAGWVEDLLDDSVLKESENLEEFRRALTQIKTQGMRCKEITHNLLSFARRTATRAEAVQLNDLVREAVAMSERKVRGGQVKIEAHLAGNLPISHVSPSEMQQVLLNLINNAIDALQGPGGQIDVSTKLDQGNLVIEVADDGQGIAKEHLPRIFDPFFTTKPVGKGTGLGLSICYGIVRKLGGSISVTSRVGVGTTFRITIPPEGPATQVGKALSPEPDRPPPAEEPCSGSLAAAVPTTVLVVDDEVLFVDAIARRLSRRHFAVLTAHSGEEALQRLQAHLNVDVVLLDVKMPGMDGIETLVELKKLAPLVEVILISGHTTVEWVIEGMKLGANDYLMKPCDMQQLLDLIEKAKERKSGQEQKILEARIKGITMSRV
ncbi:MAG: response regulator [Candidatus Riflebacteria bacterium]|nr:response regulator [Candidatus Riflebacteria bacterium]